MVLTGTVDSVRVYGATELVDVNLRESSYIRFVPTARGEYRPGDRVVVQVNQCEDGKAAPLKAQETGRTPEARIALAKQLRAFMEGAGLGWYDLRNLVSLAEQLYGQD